MLGIETNWPASRDALEPVVIRRTEAEMKLTDIMFSIHDYDQDGVFTRLEFSSTLEMFA